MWCGYRLKAAERQNRISLEPTLLLSRHLGARALLPGSFCPTPENVKLAHMRFLALKEQLADDGTGAMIRSLLLGPQFERKKRSDLSPRTPVQLWGQTQRAQGEG